MNDNIRYFKQMKTIEQSKLSKFIYFYYLMKPFIPRSFQIILRTLLIKYKKRLYKNVWPINEESSICPDNFRGWPDNKKFALVLTHDVEDIGGQKKCKKLAELEMSLGFRSAFYFVPKRYQVDSGLRDYLSKNGFEVGVHGLYHDGKLYLSRKKFIQNAPKINDIISEWNAEGFRAPAMIRNLDWHCYLNIKYDSSTFDTDPFEPQSDGCNTLFPFKYEHSVEKNMHKSFIELPYTLPQDFTLYVLLKEKNIKIWKNKLDWIVKNNGMALIITHPDYLNFGNENNIRERYPYEFYRDFLLYIKEKYENDYWPALPKEVAAFWSQNYS
jgi:hypothetical protein